MNNHLCILWAAVNLNVGYIAYLMKRQQTGTNFYFLVAVVFVELTWSMTLTFVVCPAET